MFMVRAHRAGCLRLLEDQPDGTLPLFLEVKGDLYTVRAAGGGLQQS